MTNNVCSTCGFIHRPGPGDWFTDDIIAWELGEMDDRREPEFFQGLVDSGNLPGKGNHWPVQSSARDKQRHGRRLSTMKHPDLYFIGLVLWLALWLTSAYYMIYALVKFA